MDMDERLANLERKYKVLETDMNQISDGEPGEIRGFRYDIYWEAIEAREPLIKQDQEYLNKQKVILQKQQVLTNKNMDALRENQESTKKNMNIPQKQQESTNEYINQSMDMIRKDQKSINKKMDILQKQQEKIYEINILYDKMKKKLSEIQIGTLEALIRGNKKKILLNNDDEIGLTVFNQYHNERDDITRNRNRIKPNNTTGGKKRRIKNKTHKKNKIKKSRRFIRNK